MRKPGWTRDDDLYLLNVGNRLAELYRDENGWVLEAWRDPTPSRQSKCGFIEGFRTLRAAKAAGKAWVTV